MTPLEKKAIRLVVHNQLDALVADKIDIEAFKQAIEVQEAIIDRHEKESDNDYL